MQAAQTTTLASETATTVHRTMVVSVIAIAALTAGSAAATAAPATTVGSETATVRVTAASEAEEVISSGATAAV